METVDSAAIARRATLELDSAERAIFLAALENDGTTVSNDTTPFAPLRTIRPVEHDGRYYAISYTITDTRDALGVFVRIDYDPPTTDGPTIEYEELPPQDQSVLGWLVFLQLNRRVDGWDIGTDDVYSLDQVDGSVLVPEPQYEYVRHNDQTYRIWVDTFPATISDYRYTVREIAQDQESFVRQTRDRYEFHLDGLSSAEHSIVETATRRGGYNRSQDADERAAYQSLSERFQANEAIVGSSTDPDIGYGEYLVRYDGDTYWAAMEFYR